ncbi:16S rRNA (adenine(1518)-N(6)/adenine(1519)-N(6))-dimethyltransferase RsmA [Legionella sp. CNM-4043-24]|uniref:16S rRNA (adenine(1518)-N(6)/adenine(1519)-N(6))- dimethyltransferase RsmA n=1 Tax=Legionella sp. CNM-4043-24 TaxID=3421646 RepID=UPI00403ADB1A
MSHKPRKRFGQNFLQSQPIIGQILSALNLQANDNVVEIGPGMGALTRPLLQRLNRLVAIEIDRDLQAYLTEQFGAQGRLELIAADALTIDYSQWGTGLRVIGNLPYNISTPLMLRLLSYANGIVDMHFMLQKEVVLRLAGQPGSRDYGRLSVITQYHCDVEPLFDVPPEAFYPPPRVESAVVRLTPHVSPVYPPVPMDVFQAVVARSFSMRRKTLANNLKPAIQAAQLESLGIDPGLRPEQLSVMDYVTLSNFVADRRIILA